MEIKKKTYLVNVSKFVFINSNFYNIVSLLYCACFTAFTNTKYVYVYVINMLYIYIYIYIYISIKLFVHRPLKCSVQ